MKTIKIALAIAFITFAAFLLFRNSENVNIEGYWTAKKIVLNGHQIFPSKIDKYLTTEYQVVINNWSHSIQIDGMKNEINAQFKIENSSKKTHFINLASSEESLNGSFEMTIDTTHIGPQAYQVHLKLKRNNTMLIIQKQVVVPPWKPEFPKRGQL